MTPPALCPFDWWNAARYRGQAAGFYESWFCRANHPDRPLAFWVRYTLFSPRGRPEDAVGELWGIWFDGRTGRHAAVRREVPIDRTALAADRLDVRIDEARLGPERLEGAIETDRHRLAWSLDQTGGGEPLLLLPEGFYEIGFPKAKALVGRPGCSFEGSIVVDGQEHAIDGWVGSQNHNWGTRHTDDYVWGQVAGFDGAPDAFLECATARVRLGPVWTPRLTLVVLRLGQTTHCLNGLGRAVRAHGRLDGLVWTFRTADREVEIEGRIEAGPEAFVALPYANPPGGTKTCLNSKIAACRLVVRQVGQESRVLETADRAAFEILGDAGHPEIALAFAART